MFVELSFCITNLLDIKKDFIKACGRYEVFSFILKTEYKTIFQNVIMQGQKYKNGESLIAREFIIFWHPHHVIQSKITKLLH